MEARVNESLRLSIPLYQCQGKRFALHALVKQTAKGVYTSVVMRKHNKGPQKKGSTMIILFAKKCQKLFLLISGKL